MYCSVYYIKDCPIAPCVIIIIDTHEIIVINHTCEIIDFISGGKINTKTLFYIINCSKTQITSKQTLLK